MKGLPRSLARGAVTAQPIVRQSIRVSETISVADGAPGFGSVALAAMPEGNVLFLGAVSYLQFTTADADVTATFEGDYAIGYTATADGDFGDLGEAVFIESTAIGPATAKVSPVTRGEAVGGLYDYGVLDNTDASMNVHLNLLIDDASISGAADFTVTGVVHIAYIVLGDD